MLSLSDISTLHDLISFSFFCRCASDGKTRWLLCLSVVLKELVSCFYITLECPFDVVDVRVLLGFMLYPCLRLPFAVSGCFFLF